MKLQEIFSQLSVGELSQLSIGENNAGVIDEQNQDIIINHINLALDDLHTKFPLIEKTFLLELTDGRRDYLLSSEFAQTNTKSNAVDRYIQDTSYQPFTDDLIKVLRVVTDNDVLYRLNDGTRFAIETPNEKLIRLPKNIPNELKSETLEVTYRGTIRIPTGDYLDPERFEVELPYPYLQALCFNVASRVHNPIGMANEFHAGNSYYARYQQACNDLLTNGVYVDQMHEQDVIQRAGWV